MKRKTFLIMGILIFYFTFMLSRWLLVYDDDYVCRDMAKDLEESLEERGIDTKICRGISRIGNQGHAWCVVNLSGILLNIDSIGYYFFIPELLYYDIELYESYEDYENEYN